MLNTGFNVLFLIISQLTALLSHKLFGESFVFSTFLLCYMHVGQSVVSQQWIGCRSRHNYFWPLRMNCGLFLCRWSLILLEPVLLSFRLSVFPSVCLTVLLSFGLSVFPSVSVLFLCTCVCRCVCVCWCVFELGLDRFPSCLQNSNDVRWSLDAIFLP